MTIPTIQIFAQFIASGFNGMRERGEHVWTSTFKHDTVAVYTSGSEEYHLLHKQLTRFEQDYNDAKEKGTPTKNNKDQIVGEKGKGGGVIRSLSVEGDPYSSEQLFGDETDRQNGCPKQIRYYGKDGKAEIDIEFSK